MGMSDEEANGKFGFLLEALEMGAPPHGGFAMGLERFVALMAGEPDIRQIVAFPKVSSGSDPLTGAPTPMPEEVLRELGIEARCATEGVREAGERHLDSSHARGFAPRFALEAGFLILLGVGAGYADLRPAVIVALLAGGWVLVALVELAVWRSQARPAARRRRHFAEPGEDEPERTGAEAGSRGRRARLSAPRRTPARRRPRRSRSTRVFLGGRGAPDEDAAAE